jgi:4-hydroxy-tetrahydrodipicolinate reductase
MGQWVFQLLQTEYTGKATLAASVARGEALEPLLGCDTVIDFSSPAAMVSLALMVIRSHGEGEKKLPAFVVGSTGWRPEERRHLDELSRITPVLMASNFSTGVLALTELLRQAAPVLAKLGYTPVIVESHHRHKKDAPSGTAITLQRAISAKDPASVQTHSVRAGEVIGDHEVTFYGPGDHLTLGHFAQDRSIFARGAIDVALWLAGQRGKVSPGKLVPIESYFQELSCSS